MANCRTTKRLQNSLWGTPNIFIVRVVTRSRTRGGCNKSNKSQRSGSDENNRGNEN